MNRNNIMNCNRTGVVSIVSVVMATLIICLPLSSHAGLFDDVLNAAAQGVADSLNGNNNQQNQENGSGNSGQQGGQFAIGDEHEGGIIFFIDDSGAHGLIASDTDIRGTRSWDESMTACRNYKKNNHNDWFLPNRDQLAELYLRRSVVGGWAPKSAYWSSTKSDIQGCAWLQYFSTGSQYKNFGTNYLHYARCVRAF